MHFVKSLGERYLWADSLCLIQDNAQHIGRGVKLMGLIYDGAYLTIIAANGSNADAGLPRVYEGSRTFSQCAQEVIPGLDMAVVRAVDSYVRKSTWATRGWTYQEEIFSRRSIIFANNQAYFRCRQRIWAEDTWADMNHKEQDLAEWSASWVVMIQDVEFDLLIHPLERLLNLIEGFQQRTLSRDSDAINAVAGILAPLSKRMRTSLLEGLPTCAFDLVLLFSHDHTLGSANPGRRRSGFLSWSWAGWVGRTHWNAFHDLYRTHDVAGINKWLDQRTWIRWYKFENGQFTRIVRYTEPVADSKRDSRDVMYERRSPLPPFSERFAGLKTSRTEPANCFAKNISYPLLAFFTVSITFSVSSDIPTRFNQVRQAHLLDALFDKENNFCGLISPDASHATIEHRRIELIIVSECQTSSFPALDRTGLENRIHPIWSTYGTLGKEGRGADWQLFWVLAITWTGECYERRGLGQILQSSVDKSLSPGAQWKEITFG